MSKWLSQENRFLQITTALNINELILTEISGYESLSTIFNFRLDLISHNTHILCNELLGTPVAIQLNTQQSAQPRYFHGHIFNFQAGHINEGVRSYHAEINPWLWFLKFNADSRIFQNKSAIDILKLIFSEFNFSNYDLSKLTRTYQKREYCVQYNETTFDFINRLLEEEGIFYFFRHEQNKHTLVLADKTATLPRATDSNVVYETGSNTTHGLTQWQRHYNFYSGNFTQTDHNFENPDANLTSKQQSNAKLAAAKKYEVFHYPGKHQETTQGKSLAQQHFDAQEGHHDMIVGEGNYPNFSCGNKFTLSDCPNAADEGDYILTSVTHYAADSSHSHGSQGGHIYNNLFTCIPANISYRPLQATSKPVIIGSQTATVVGPANEDLYTDKYGRVKVQFHWDRQGKKDDYSSCWIRVAQSWAGKNWGTLFMPRIGQEVIVQFLNGDPDRPLIMGSVYNADNLPPYALPISQTQSGIKTRSTKGGGASDANELRFEDKSGQEEIYIHAQKDLNYVIENNETTLIVRGDQSIKVQAGESIIEAAQAITLKVGESILKMTPQKIIINTPDCSVNEISI